MVCPDCNGKGQSVALTRGYLRLFVCDRCQGNGNVTDEMAEWVEDGRRLRDMRMVPYRNLGTDAKRRGLGVVELSQMERGVIKPVFPEGSHV